LLTHRDFSLSQPPTTDQADRPHTSDSIRISKIKDRVTDKLFARRRGAKLLEGSEYATEQLLEAFRHMDPDLSGFIAKDKLVEVFGPKMLNLGIPPEEVDRRGRNPSQS
jgi:hypothetical protein